MSVLAAVQFVRLGTGRERELKGGHGVVLMPCSTDDSPALAATVSAAARKLVPSLKATRLRIRVTTPDGGSWPIGYVYLDDADTGRRVGHGLLQANDDETGRQLRLVPYRTIEPERNEP